MTAPPPEEAREAAREILSRDEYRTVHTPRPLRGVLEQIGEWLEPLAEPLADAYAWVVREPGRWVPAAAAIVLLAVLSTVALGRRRAAFAGVDRRSRSGVEIEDADELERRADAAERAGDLDAAVRLRFRAGLVRLGERGALAYRPSLTAGAATRAIASPTLAALAATFDAIAYGGRPAAAADVDDAKTGWRRVLQDVR